MRSSNISALEEEFRSALKDETNVRHEDVEEIESFLQTIVRPEAKMNQQQAGFVTPETRPPDESLRRPGEAIGERLDSDRQAKLTRETGFFKVVSAVGA